MAISIKVAAHLCTTNDTNGNPRRLYCGWDRNGNLIAVHDEGYGNAPAWWNKAINIGRIDVTPGEYRAFKGVKNIFKVES